MLIPLLRYSLPYWIRYNPWGSLFGVIAVFLIGAALIGAFGFRKKDEKQEAVIDENSPEDRLAMLQSVQEFLRTRVDGSFRVDYFDGAYQIFTAPDLELSNEELYSKLRLRFPHLVVAIHQSSSELVNESSSSQQTN